MATNIEGEFQVHWEGQGGQEEGSLSLLWSLIESYKIDIFSVSIERITNDFISYINQLPEIDLKLASNFTYMAANLLYYKSRELLPASSVEEEAEQTLPAELVLQLLEYKKYQQAAEKLASQEALAALRFSRPKTSMANTDANSYVEFSLIDLLQAFSRFIKTEEKRGEMHILEADNYFVSDKIDAIKEILNVQNEIYFLDLLSGGKASRGEIVATFLALLELVKINFMLVLQEKLFGRILLRKLWN